MLAPTSLALYFMLNLLVTVSNLAIMTRSTPSCPYLLTVSHATATFVSTSVVSIMSSARRRRRRRSSSSSPAAGRRPRLALALLAFSALFAVNISLSNYSLGLVSSLPVHQTIRAVAPPLTVAVSIMLGLKSVRSYRIQTYLSLLPIVLGVALAATSASSAASAASASGTTGTSVTPPFGVWMTLLGAVTAVLKTIAAHALQTDMAIPGHELVHTTAPLAAVQGLVAAWWHGEFTFGIQPLRSAWRPWWRQSHHSASATLFLLNAALAAALNLASFEANKRCGPLTMGVAANLKQVVVLLVRDSHGGPPSRNVVVGSLATVLGGLWYVLSMQ